MSAEKHSREEMMVRDLDVTMQALRAENQQVERLWSCLSAMETALTVANREMVTAEAASG
jgi:hypothetical protein